MKVVLTAAAKDDLDRNVGWWAENRSREQAARWKDLAVRTVRALGRWPRSFPLARENDRCADELRECYFGLNRSKTHRLVFRVLSNRVEVFAVRGITQDDLPDDQIP